MFHYTLMSNRSWSSQALVLSLSSFGEGNREALLLTPDRGLVRAAVFGGAKSRLRSLVSPYQTGIAWVYTDPVKKTSKITDFDVQAWRPGIREGLVRTWCAALCAEIVTRSHGIADWRLVNAFLDGIEVSGEDECRRGLLRFLWRLLTTAGIAPDTSCCARCGTETRAAPGGDGESGAPDGGENRENTILFYSPHEDACVCPECARGGERGFPLSGESLAFLAAIDRLGPADARRFQPGPRCYAELRGFLFFLVSRMVDGTLKTLETGDGIL